MTYIKKPMNKGKNAHAKGRNKRSHHSQAYDVDEKFSLKVQKKPINGLNKHIQVQQAQGPSGNKLYQIKVKQKSPIGRRIAGIKDSIEGQPQR